MSAVSDSVLRVVGLLALLAGIVVVGVLEGAQLWMAAAVLGACLAAASFEGTFRTWRDAEARASAADEGPALTFIDKLKLKLKAGESYVALLRARRAVNGKPGPEMLSKGIQWQVEVYELLKCAGYQTQADRWLNEPRSLPAIVDGETIEDLGAPLGAALNHVELLEEIIGELAPQETQAN